MFTGGQFERSQTTYQYDPLGRIEHAHTQGNGCAPYDERFRFDPAHNLIEHNNQIIKNNRLSHYGGVGFTYDTFGNTVETAYDSDNRIDYRYDLNDRLVSAEINTRYRKESWIYYYDALGRRLAKARLNKQGEPEIHTMFVWDGSHLVQETHKAQVQNAQNIQNAQKTDRTFTYIYRHPNSYEPLAQCIDRRDEQGNRIEHEINYFHCDQIGIPREMTDSQGKLIWRGRYDAWGGLHYDRRLAQENQGHQPFRLQNQYLDQETGLHYNFLRYYEPMMGRFISQDPIGLQGGMNFYQFADNAQGWSDALGLSAAGAATGVLSLIAADTATPDPTDVAWPKWVAYGILGAAATGVIALSEADTDTGKCDKNQCPPCKTVNGKIIPVGTIGYRLDQVPPSKPHYPYTGSHYHLYKANQNPNNCRCFWGKHGMLDVTRGETPPVDAIPAEPFQ